MFKAIHPFLITLIVVMFILGCSGTGMNPITPVDDPEEVIPVYTPVEPDPVREPVSERVLWGLWNVTFESGEMKIDVEPARNLQAHFNITNMIIPPACDDCFSIAVNGFDTVTRILDADVSLRNPTPIGGRDVRGILHTNDYGHLITNPDDWTAFWDMPGGDTINPFIAYSKDDPYRVFPGNTELTENYLVYIPKPPAYFAITFAVDASWPGNCKEPYSIENFIQNGELFPIVGSSVDINVTILDWQEDAKFAQLKVPEITGTEYVDLINPISNELWELELVNSLGAPAGEYEAMIRVSSEHVEGTYLYDFVTITISDTDNPIVTGIDPDSGNIGETLVDAAISGANFLGPCEVELRLDSYTITTTDVEVIDAENLTCDFTIPLDADIGLYDVVVQNFDAKTGIGEDLFEVTTLAPVVTSINPESGNLNQHIENAEISGSNFLGPCEVILRQDAYAITAYDIDVTGPSTIICDFTIPLDADIGLYDVVVKNFDTKTGVGVDLFEVTTLAPVVTSINPESGNVNQHIENAEISGSNFLGPCEVIIRQDAYAITAYDIDVIDPSTIICDFDIPLDAELGLYDVIVKNFDAKTGVGVDLFEVICPTPVVSSIDPDIGDVYSTLSGVVITGSYFIGPTAEVKLKKTAAVDIVADNVVVVSETEINCDITIPIDQELGLYGVNVTNGCGAVGEAPDYLEVICPVPVVASCNPDTGDQDETLVDVEITGENFIYPGVEVRLKKAGEPDIIAANIAVTDTTLLDCDITIPPGAAPGMYDVEVANGCGESGIGMDMFEVLAPPIGWATTWGGLDEDEGWAVAVDDDGNSYVTGYFRNTVDFDPGTGVVEYTSVGSTDVFLCKFNPQSELEWARTWGSTSGDRGYGVAVDYSGTVLVTGHFQAATDFDPGPGTENRTPVGSTDAYLSAFSSDGQFYGVSTWGSSTGDGGVAVITDGLDAYVTGTFSGTVDFDWDPVGVESRTSKGAMDVFLLKVVGEGDFGWVQTWGGSDNDEGRAIAVDSSGNVFVTGYFNDTVDFDPDPVDVDSYYAHGNSWSYVSKFDSSGEYLWANTWGKFYDCHGEGVAVDSSGNAYVVGFYTWDPIDLDPDPIDEDIHANTGKIDSYMSKFDPSGDYIWGMHWGGADEDKALGIASNSAGDIYVSGFFTGNADLDPDAVDVDTHTGFVESAFLSKFTSGGDYVWGKSWANVNYGYGRSVAVNDAGESWSTGWFKGSSVDFNPDPVDEDLHTSNGSHDVFLIKFLPDGTW